MVGFLIGRMLRLSVGRYNLRMSNAGLDILLRTISHGLAVVTLLVLDFIEGSLQVSHLGEHRDV